MHTQSQRIVLTTFGSFGDLNPFIALARGHQPMIATSAYYRDVIQAAGISFHSVHPDLDPQDKSLLRHAMHPRRGTEVIIRAIVLFVIRKTYADLSGVLQMRGFPLKPLKKMVPFGRPKEDKVKLIKIVYKILEYILINVI